MSYQVLARKWRPRNFSTLVGQEHVVRALTHALTENRLHHAYLFTGTRGIGKTTIARILAKSLNCEAGVSAEPCGQCSACQEIDAGRFVDLLEVDAATNTKVDEMRQLLENAVYAPTRGRYKVYVIDEVHMLSTSAFNAMLKTLEEPPEHVKFILATTDPQKIPVTVLSRCLQFNLKQMPVAAIVEHLTRILGAEEIPFEAEALHHLARAASGSMRDALSLLDQAIAHGAGEVKAEEVRAMLGTVNSARLLDVLDAVADEDAERLYALAEEMRAQSLSPANALQELAALLTRLQLLQLAPGLSGDDELAAPRLKTLAGRFSPEFVQLAYQIAAQGRQELALAPDEYSGFLMSLLRLLAFTPNAGDGGAAPGGSTGAARQAASVPSPQAAPGGEHSLSAGPARPASSVSSPPAASPSEHSPSAGPGPGLGDWHGLLASLKISGFVKQLANNCDLVAQEALASGGVRVVLHLPPGKRQLLAASHQDKLRLALVERLGGPVDLRIEVQEVANATPAQVAAAVRSERQAEAVAAIEADPFVRAALTTLDASIVDGSIQPISE